MSLQRGFVQSIEARDDGWVEVVLLALHSSNTRRTYFLPSLDGDLSKAHQRLTQVSLLRDALAQTSPVEIEYINDEKQGSVISDVTVYTDTSLDQRQGSYWVDGVVVSVSVQERGPQSSSTPYLDSADVAHFVLLRSSGALETYTLDLQRAETETAQSMLRLLIAAEQSRRSISVQLSSSGREGGAFIVGAREQQEIARELQQKMVFLERMGQRPESYQEDRPELQNHLWIRYTTAPEQVPEGDISENGAFVPKTEEARLHHDSPLVPRLSDALRDELQVQLFLQSDIVHGVEIVAGLGSVARPIWIHFSGRAVDGKGSGLCVNQPTISPPTSSALNAIPHSLSLSGQAYFGKGIWRLVTLGQSEVTVFVDGKQVGCESSVRYRTSTALGRPDQVSVKPVEQDEFGKEEREKADAMSNMAGQAALRSVARSAVDKREGQHQTTHLYLDGLHEIEFLVHDHTCASKFYSHFYRIR